jgi:hypothetical protein
MLVRADPEIAERPLVPMLDSGAGDHLRANKAGSEAAPLSPEGLDAHPGHRGEDDPRGHLDGPDFPALAEFQQGSHRVLQSY